MRNVVAVLMIAAGAIAALTLTGGGDKTMTTVTTATSAAPAEQEQLGTPRWEYRVVSTRIAPGPQAKSDRNVRLVAWSAEADAAKDLERELNRLAGEGWDMCSASGDGTMVFRRAR